MLNPGSVNSLATSSTVLRHLSFQPAYPYLCIHQVFDGKEEWENKSFGNSIPHFSYHKTHPFPSKYILWSECYLKSKPERRGKDVSLKVSASYRVKNVVFFLVWFGLVSVLEPHCQCSRKTSNHSQGICRAWTLAHWAKQLPNPGSGIFLIQWKHLAKQEKEERQILYLSPETREPGSPGNQVCEVIHLAE